MRIWKRVSASLCVLVLILHLAFFPVRAHAAATAAGAALTAVGLAVTVTAFLNMAGVYPFINGSSDMTFPEWAEGPLQSLINEYNAFQATQSLMVNANTVKAYAVGGTIAVANQSYKALRAFVQWIKTQFSVTDNQQGLVLGGALTPNGGLPYASTVDSAFLYSQGFVAGSYNRTVRYYAADMPDVYIGRFTDYTGYGYGQIVFASIRLDGMSVPHAYYMSTATTTGTVSTANLATTRTYGDYDFFTTVVITSGLHSESVQNIPYYADWAPFFEYILEQNNLAGDDVVVVDTTTVVVPDELPESADFAGIQIAGAGVGVTAQALEDIITSGVQEREKPVARPVEVEIGAGIEVDSQTGEITENPVVVTPEDVVPTVAALSPSAAFISALQTTMTTKFPFCLPFDLFKILQAFYVAPEAPVFSLSFHDPFSNGDFSIRVDLSPWDEVAAVVRNFQAMILLAGFCLNFDKFNVIHLILGGLG